MRRAQAAGPVLGALSLMALSALVLWPVVAGDSPWPRAPGDYLEAHGQAESGAQNLVSAIYLGYRAYDTLGEAIVLLVAVTGAIGMIASAGDARGGAADTRYGGAARRRTELLDVVTGKLGPVVLVFGVYVMMFGHISPGGGFQGGVVVASGIVFLSLGRRSSQGPRITRAGTLAAVEALSFLVIMLTAGLGLVTGSGFMGNPLPGASPVVAIVVLNALIGLKVGAGISLMCVAMLAEANEPW
ncbi:MAG: hypothetical protein KBB32_01460 [Spirochaetia bacterium]|nr:hypothetical protein [Spirochaetia bacterium]